MDVKYIPIIIVELVKKIRGSNNSIGKTKLQKLIYFLQEKGIPMNYHYEIYHYGPYSFELADVLNSLDAIGILRVSLEPGGYGYDIQLGKYAKLLKKEDRKHILNKFGNDIDFIINNFGNGTRAELEAEATIHYVAKVLKKQGIEETNKILNKVKQLKPKFPKGFLVKRYKKLEKVELL